MLCGLCIGQFISNFIFEKGKNMEKSYKFTCTNRICLEQSPLSLVLEYSETSGFRMESHYRFQIPLSSIPVTVEIRTEEIVNSPELRNFTSEIISWEEIPDQVIKDALNWLDFNIEQVNKANNVKLESILDGLKEKIQRGVSH